MVENSFGKRSDMSFEIPENANQPRLDITELKTRIPNTNANLSTNYKLKYHCLLLEIYLGQSSTLQHLLETVETHLLRVQITTCLEFNGIT